MELDGEGVFTASVSEIEGKVNVGMDETALRSDIELPISTTALSESSFPPSSGCGKM
jgi:hypothetical protein